MKFVYFSVLALLGLCQAANAAITFKLAPNNQTAYAGQTMTFTLALQSSQIAGEGINAVDFNVLAGAGDGTGGTFVAPTNTVILGNGPVDYTSTPGQAFGTNVQATNITIPQAGVLISNLFLNTTGVAAGNYTLSLSDLAANDAVSGGVGVFGSTVNYQILSAVPEPTSILTASTLALGAVFYRKRRAKLTKSRNASVKRS